MRGRPKANLELTEVQRQELGNGVKEYEPIQRLLCFQIRGRISHI